MSANDTQVGGSHYKTVMQHWDLAAKLKLGYFEGQVSKYLTRHRYKKGKEDVEKALHFTKKLLELAILSDYRPVHLYGTIAYFTEYAQANKLLPLEHTSIMSICGWSMPQDLEILITRIERLRDECYPALPVPEVHEEPDGDAFRSPAFAKALQDGSIQGRPDGHCVDQGRDI